jgi:hypothetical protein
MSPCGTFPTCRGGLTMSVHRVQSGSGRTTVEMTRLTHNRSPPRDGMPVKAKIGKIEINNPPWSEHELSSA